MPALKVVLYLVQGEMYAAFNDDVISRIVNEGEAAI